MNKHTFTSSRLLPTGIRVTTVITVPAERAWKDMGELSEIAAMGAARTAAAAEQSWKHEDDRMPF